MMRIKQELIGWYENDMQLRKVPENAIGIHPILTGLYECMF